VTALAAVGQLLEGLACGGLAVQGGHEIFGNLDLPRLGVRDDIDVYLVAGRDACLRADLGAHRDQGPAAHGPDGARVVDGDLDAAGNPAGRARRFRAQLHLRIICNCANPAFSL
jgi:hypothetical protein